MPRADFCSRFHHAVELIGARWTGAIMQAVLAGTHRYADIKSSIPGLSDTMLAQRLHELEQEGLLERRVNSSGPVRVDYHPTKKGRALGAALDAVSAWADAWVDIPQRVASR